MRKTRDLSYGDRRVYLEFEVRRVQCKRCGRVKREQLDFLADNPFYTKRFAYYVGRRCRSGTIKDIAEELKLDWDTVKVLEKQYMAAHLAKAGKPGPKAIGIDEISIKRGHTYRIVVSDLIRRRPIWFGGEDRSEASMRQFYDGLGKRKTAGIRLAVMDMWHCHLHGGSRFATPRARTRHRQRSCSTSFTSCAIWAKRSTRYARPNTGDSAARAEASSRARNTRCCRIGRISAWRGGAA